MKKFWSLLMFAAFFVAACNSKSADATDEETEEEERPAKKKDLYGRMAVDVCNCLRPLTENMSPEAKKVFRKAMNNPNNAEEAVQDELMKLDEDRRAEVSEEIESISTKMQSEDSKANKCMQKLSKKYPDEPEDEKKAIRKLIAAMEDEEDCEMAASLFRAYLSRE